MADFVYFVWITQLDSKLSLEKLAAKETLPVCPPNVYGSFKHGFLPVTITLLTQLGIGFIYLWGLYADNDYGSRPDFTRAETFMFYYIGIAVMMCVGIRARESKQQEAVWWQLILQLRDDHEKYSLKFNEVSSRDVRGLQAQDLGPLRSRAEAAMLVLSLSLSFACRASSLPARGSKSHPAVYARRKRVKRYTSSKM